MSIHNVHRPVTRSTLRRPFRHLNRAGLRGRRRGPDDFTQMLTAYGRALRAHRKLIRLAPSFFDAAVVDRERENRAEQRRWMAMWEPVLAKVYGVDPKPVADHSAWPSLPSPAIQRAVDRQLAEVQLWLGEAHAARERHRQYRPHAVPTLTQLARLLDRAFELKKIVLGLDSPNPLPEKITYDYEFTDLKRAYGHRCDSDEAGSDPSNPPASPSAAPVTPVLSASAPVPPAPLSLTSPRTVHAR